jgi:enoyl-CoA hydratase
MSNVIVEKNGRIIYVTLNKQPLNIMEQNYYGEIQRTFEEISQTEGYCAVVLKSACKHFCAGGQLEEIPACTNAENTNIVAGAACGCMVAIYSCKYPVLAAVHGKCIGSGVAIALSCDVVVAAENATFALAEVKAGFIGASEFLEMGIPHRLARYYIFSGDAMTPQQWKQWGALYDVVPVEQLYTRVDEIAEKIAEQSPLALAYFKEAMNINDNERLSEKYMFEATYTTKYNSSEDCKETFRAFKEKRKPNYQGR